MNSAKFLRTPFNRAPLDDCFFILQVPQNNLITSVKVWLTLGLQRRNAFVLFFFFFPNRFFFSGLKWIFERVQMDHKYRWRQELIKSFLRSTEIPVGKYLKSYSYSSIIFVGFEQVFSFSDGDFSCICLSLIKKNNLV